MKRRLLSLLAALSLLLCIATVALWLRSYWRLDEVSFVTNDHGHRIRSVAGTLHFGAASPLMYAKGLHWQVSSFPSYTPDWKWLYPGRNQSGGYGFAVVNGEYDLGRAWVFYRVTVVPMWPLALLLSVGPVAWLVRGMRRPGKPIGLCPHCGYDLRAHNPGDRCPECGTPIPPGAKA